MSDILLGICASSALLCGLGVIFSPQALQSLVWMLGVILSLSGVMAAVGANLLATVLVLVYAGAILVLFAFVIMFMGQRQPPQQIGRLRLIFAILVVIVFLFVLSRAFYWSIGLDASSAKLSWLNISSLYGDALFSFEKIGWLLTMLGGWILLWTAVGVVNISDSHKEVLATRIDSKNKKEGNDGQ